MQMLESVVNYPSHHESIDKMTHQTDMDPKRKGVIRRSRSFGKVTLFLV